MLQYWTRERKISTIIYIRKPMPKSLLYIKSETFLRDWYAQMTNALSLAINLWMWIMLYSRVYPTHELVTLHYNIYFGITLAGEWYKIFLIPFFGFLVIVINFFFSLLWYERDKLASYITIAVSCIIQAILLFSAYLVTSFTHV